MKTFFLLLYCGFLSIASFAQSNYYTISGTVWDAAAKTPLQGASVYAENTTMGTATDADGKFVLYLPNGGYNLIVSFTGYNTTDLRVSTATSSEPLRIEMSIREKSLQEVAIVSSNEVKNGWEKYGSFFQDEFIGKTQEAKKCSIKNPEILKFFFSKRKNRLKVLASEPVLIENNALGYTIKYELDSFVHEYNSTATIYTGYPLFEEMKSEDTSLISQWQKAREEVYYGSILHFMRSLFRQKLNEDGFELQWVKNMDGRDSMVLVQEYYRWLGCSFNEDKTLLFLQPTEKVTGVLYKDAEPDSGYLKENTEAPATFQFSTLRLLGDAKLTVENNGFYFDTNEVSIADYWEWSKMANTLPFDYWPKP